MDASLVCSSTTLPLNKLETVSVVGKVLGCNNPEVKNKRQQVARLKVFIPVLSIAGSPLMPCTFTKAKRLLKRGKAKIVNRNPLIIRLTFSCENQTQPIVLGVDTGYSTIGFSTVTGNKELVSGELLLDNNTNKRLTERKGYRRNRRNRLRYRKPRFDNRSIPKRWLPPSVRRRFDTHVKLIANLRKWIPITTIVVEMCKFDIQKIINPKIAGKGYQQGNLYEYNNLKDFLFFREQGKCQFCGKKIEINQKAHLNHVIPRAENGTDRPDNIALLHKDCHDKLHKGKFFKINKAKQYKTETFMSIISKKLQEILGCEITYGYITKTKRKLLGIEKSHANDAFVIAKGNAQERCAPYRVEQKRINNRILQTNRKGFIPSIRKQRYKIQNRDFVWINGNKYLCGGTSSRGKEVRYFYNNEKKFAGIKKIEKVYHTNSLVWVS